MNPFIFITPLFTEILENSAQIKENFKYTTTHKITTQQVYSTYCHLKDKQCYKNSLALKVA